MIDQILTHLRTRATREAHAGAHGVARAQVLARKGNGAYPRPSLIEIPIPKSLLTALTVRPVGGKYPPNRFGRCANLGVNRTPALA